jgi:hypothetical protein
MFQCNLRQNRFFAIAALYYIQYNFCIMFDKNAEHATDWFTEIFSSRGKSERRKRFSRFFRHFRADIERVGGSWVLGKNFWGGWTIAGRDKNPLDRLSSKS